MVYLRCGRAGIQSNLIILVLDTKYGRDRKKSGIKESSGILFLAPIQIIPAQFY